MWGLVPFFIGGASFFIGVLHFLSAFFDFLPLGQCFLSAVSGIVFIILWILSWVPSSSTTFLLIEARNSDGFVFCESGIICKVFLYILEIFGRFSFFLELFGRFS
jgi:hypothetical protein